MSLRRGRTPGDRRRWATRTSMLVRTIRSHGHFRWKKHDVFLSEVLWGEQVGLLPFDDGMLYRLLCRPAPDRLRQQTR